MLFEAYAPDAPDSGYYLRMFDSGWGEGDPAEGDAYDVAVRSADGRILAKASAKGEVHHPGGPCGPACPRALLRQVGDAG